MVFEYGSYRHPDAEVALKSTGKRALRSDRGFVYGYELSMDLMLTMRSTGGQSAIVAKAGQLERVYSAQNQRATLYTNDGRIAFRFEPAQSVGGLHVDSLIYPDVTGAAMVTTLKAEISLRMETEVTGAEEILEYEESIEISGGLPKIVYLPRSRGRYDRQMTTGPQPYVATQSGYAIGRRARPSPPRYAFQNADEIDRRVSKLSPSRLRQGVLRRFGVQWSYTFMSNEPLNAEPNIL